MPPQIPQPVFLSGGGRRGVGEQLLLALAGGGIDILGGILASRLDPNRQAELERLRAATAAEQARATEAQAGAEAQRSQTRLAEEQAARSIEAEEIGEAAAGEAAIQGFGDLAALTADLAPELSAHVGQIQQTLQQGQAGAQALPSSVQMSAGLSIPQAEAAPQGVGLPGGQSVNITPSPMRVAKEQRRQRGVDLAPAAKRAVRVANATAIKRWQAFTGGKATSELFTDIQDSKSQREYQQRMAAAREAEVANQIRQTKLNTIDRAIEGAANWSQLRASEALGYAQFIANTGVPLEEALRAAAVMAAYPLDPREQQLLREAKEDELLARYEGGESNVFLETYNQLRVASQQRAANLMSLSGDELAYFESFLRPSVITTTDGKVKVKNEGLPDFARAFSELQEDLRDKRANQRVELEGGAKLSDARIKELIEFGREYYAMTSMGTFAAPAEISDESARRVRRQSSLPQVGGAVGAGQAAGEALGNVDIQQLLQLIDQGLPGLARSPVPIS